MALQKFGTGKFIVRKWFFDISAKSLIENLIFCKLEKMLFYFCSLLTEVAAAQNLTALHQSSPTNQTADEKPKNSILDIIRIVEFNF